MIRKEPAEGSQGHSRERIIKESRKWIDAVLASQRPDAYFGDEKNRKDSDLWPNMS